ncbi:MAG: sugar phosphate isomerase/epimerase [Actinobacteria bacterium]|nr:sugar phosphate isomerase/epimerase [Actinomycetota bacterium]
MATPQLSVQLYTVRDQLADDLDGTLERLAALGFAQVEAFDLVNSAPALAGALRRHGLRAPTAHAMFLGDAIAAGADEVPTAMLDAVFDAAAELGVGTVFEPFVGPEHWGSADQVRRTADLLNRASAAAAARGIALGYHNHSMEFHHSFDGVSAYELFAAELDPAVVLELDAYWAQVGRQDVPALAARLGSRIAALHVKDGSTDNDRFLPGVPDTAPLGQVPAGLGAVPLAAVLAAAPGLDYAVVEFDAVDGDIFAAIAGTVGFLAQLGIR